MLKANLRSIDADDLANGGSARKQRLPEAGSLIAEGTHDSRAGDDDAMHAIRGTKR